MYEWSKERFRIVLLENMQILKGRVKILVEPYQGEHGVILAKVQLGTYRIQRWDGTALIFKLGEFEVINEVDKKDRSRKDHKPNKGNRRFTGEIRASKKCKFNPVKD